MKTLSLLFFFSFFTYSQEKLSPTEHPYYQALHSSFKYSYQKTATLLVKKGFDLSILRLFYKKNSYAYCGLMGIGFIDIFRNSEIFMNLPTDETLYAFLRIATEEAEKVLDEITNNYTKDHFLERAKKEIPNFYDSNLPPVVKNLSEKYEEFSKKKVETVAGILESDLSETERRAKIFDEMREDINKLIKKDITDVIALNRRLMTLITFELFAEIILYTQTGFTYPEHITTAAIVEENPFYLLYGDRNDSVEIAQEKVIQSFKYLKKTKYTLHLNKMYKSHYLLARKVSQYTALQLLEFGDPHAKQCSKKLLQHSMDQSYSFQMQNLVSSRDNTTTSTTSEVSREHSLDYEHIKFLSLCPLLKFYQNQTQEKSLTSQERDIYLSLIPFLKEEGISKHQCQRFSCYY